MQKKEIPEHLIFEPLLEKGVFADACGNTFIIYDYLSYSMTSEEWDEIKEKIWNFLPQIDVDDALVLRKIDETDEMIMIKMHVLEPDGTEADFCGNGARTIGLFLDQKYKHQKFCLSSKQGIHRFLYLDGECFIEIKNPIIHDKELFLFFQKKYYKFQFVDCVEPHLVTSDFFDAQLLTMLAYEINLKWRKQFSSGINVNCLRLVDTKTIEVLTFERGVYKITEACGTGSCACVKVAVEQKMIDLCKEISVQVGGGTLKICQIDQSFWLGGPVIFKKNHL